MEVVTDPRRFLAPGPVTCFPRASSNASSTATYCAIPPFTIAPNVSSFRQIRLRFTIDLDTEPCGHYNYYLFLNSRKV